MPGITLNIDSKPVEIMEELKEQQHYKNMWREQSKQQTKEIEKLKEDVETLKSMRVDDKEHIDLLDMTIEQLKEENEKLKKRSFYATNLLMDLLKN